MKHSPFKFLILAPCLIPLGALAYLVNKYGVNLPFSDQWELVGLIQKSRSSGVEIGDLFAQHGEQRMFFPRLAMLVLAPITQWNVRVELFTNVLLAVAMFLILFFMLRTTLAPMGAWILAPLIALSVLVFSPVQWEDWLWGWQISWFLPLLSLVVAAAVLSTWPPTRSAVPAVLLAAASAVIGQYSLLSGTLIWVVCVPILLIRKNLRKLTPVWLVLAAVSTGAYLFNYVSPASMESFHVPLPEIIKDPKPAAAYLLYFVGRPVLDQEPSYLMGAVTIAAFVGLVAFLFLRRRDRLERAAFWLAVGGYAASAAMLTTVGRLGLGLQFAGSSRYTTVGILLMISTLALAGVVLTPDQPDVEPDQPSSKATGRTRFARPDSGVLGIAALWVLVAGLFIADYPSEVESMKVWHAERQQIKACLVAAKSPDDPCLLKAYPLGPVVYERAKYLKSIGWSGFD